MATKLDKPVTRETELRYQCRHWLVSLKPANKSEFDPLTGKATSVGGPERIEVRLKGRRSPPMVVSMVDFIEWMKRRNW